MAVPRFSEYGLPSDGGGLGAAFDVLERAIDRQRAQARAEEAQRRLGEESDIRMAKERQELEHAKILNPYKRDLLRAQIEKTKVPLEELSQMNYYRKMALESGDKETAEQLKGMMHNYAGIHYLQGDAREIGGLIELRDNLARQGKTDEADNINGVIRDKIAQRHGLTSREDLEAHRQELKDFSKFEDEVSHNTDRAASGIDKIEEFRKHYGETSRFLKGWKVTPGTKLGDFLRKFATTHSNSYQAMMKSVGRLQQEDIKGLRGTGRLTLKLQDLLASSTLDPSLGESGVNQVSHELQGTLEQQRLKLSFLNAAKGNGVRSVSDIENAWHQYLKDNPSYLIDKEGRYSINKKALTKDVWGKYVPKYSEEDLQYTMDRTGLSREKVLEILGKKR